jgi:hypothetical protein
MRINWLCLSGLGFLLNFCCAFAAPLDNWHWRNPLPNGNPQAGPHLLNGIAFGAGKFVAVGASGVVSTSTDITNWIESATATTNDLKGIIYARGQFVAVGNGGAVETSGDGANWVQQNSGTTNPLSSVAYGNGKFVAVGGNAVIASPNAVNWTAATSGLSGASTIAGGSNGFVAVAASAQAYFSSDGLAWTTKTLTAPGNSFNGSSLVNAIVTYWNGLFLIGSYRYTGISFADDFIFTSTDGVDWSTNALGSQSTGYLGFSYDCFMIGSNDVIASGAAFNEPFLQVSTNGTNWSQTSELPYANGQNNFGTIAGAYGNGNYVFLAPVNIGNPLPPIFTSTDGLTWTNRQHAPRRRPDRLILLPALPRTTGFMLWPRAIHSPFRPMGCPMPLPAIPRPCFRCLPSTTNLWVSGRAEPFMFQPTVIPGRNILPPPPAVFMAWWWEMDCSWRSGTGAPYKLRPRD